MEWGPSNVRVVSVSPGPIGDTEGYERLGSYDLNIVSSCLTLIILFLPDIQGEKLSRRLISHQISLLEGLVKDWT